MEQCSRYAVLLKAHFWDEDILTRINELVRAAPNGDVFLFLDETRGTIDDASPVSTIRCTISDAQRIGLALLPPSAVFWYNTDYPIYLAAEQLAAYDYVLMTEHDCVVRVDLDEMVKLARADRIDFVAEPIRAQMANWHWLPSLNGAYAMNVACAYLTCTCLVSRAAWRHLFARRVRLSEEYTEGVLQARRRPLAEPLAPGVLESWPFAEAFMGTDLVQAGFRVASLSTYGTTAGYDWWPPQLDTVVAQAVEAGFFHPVLSEKRYIDSLIRIHHNPAEWFIEDSDLRRRLDLCDRNAVVRRLVTQFSYRDRWADLRRLRLTMPQQDWLDRDFGYDACSRFRPSTSSESTDRPQWWCIDLEQAHEAYRIRLFPSVTPMLTAEVILEVAAHKGEFRPIGKLLPGEAAEPVDLRFDPPLFLRYVRLWCDSHDILRTGRLEVLAEQS